MEKSMDYDLVTKTCIREGCIGVFSVMPNDPQVCCSFPCQDKVGITTPKARRERDLPKPTKNRERAEVKFGEIDAQRYAKEYLANGDILIELETKYKTVDTRYVPTTVWLILRYFNKATNSVMTSKVNEEAGKIPCPIKIKIKPDIKNVFPIQNIEKKKKSESVNITKITKKQSTKESENSIPTMSMSVNENQESHKNTEQQTKKKPEQKKISIRPNTEMKSTSDKGSDMQQTELTSAEKSENAGGSLIPHLDSTHQSLTSSMVESHSMNLIDSSANQLFGLMKGLTHNHPPDKLELQSYQPHIVDSAVDCAREIRNLMTLKLEVLKFGHEIQKGKE